MPVGRLLGDGGWGHEGGGDGSSVRNRWASEGPQPTDVTLQERSKVSLSEIGLIIPVYTYGELQYRVS